MQDAELYASSNQMQRRDASIVLAAHLPVMTWKEEDERILDIGSGSGDVTTTLLSQAIPVYHSLTGVDVSKEMVEYANRTYGEETVTFHCMDIATCKSPRDQFPAGFSKVFSLYCLHWVRDLSRAVSNMFDLLVEGGEALVVFLASNPIFRMYRILAQNPKWTTYMKDVEEFMPVYQDSTDPGKEFRAILTRAGFTVRNCEATEFSYTFHNQNQLAAALKAVNPFLCRIPLELQHEFIMESLILLNKMENHLGTTRAEARYKLMVAYMKKPDRKMSI